MRYVSRYEPVNILSEINKILDQGFTRDTSNVESSQWVPAIDIKEDKKQFVILADLPGVDKKDINISMENNILTIRGTRNLEEKESLESYYRVERVRGSFYRRFTLSDTADGCRIEAKMQKGVLEIIIPKKETAQPRSIEISGED